jgi:hypothetical protein
MLGWKYLFKSPVFTLSQKKNVLLFSVRLV